MVALLGVGAGKDFTAAQKQKMLEENMKRKGITPDPNEWQFDHIIPKDKGGTNSYSNCQIVSRKYTRENGINRSETV